MATTLEEARKCPKCFVPGEEGPEVKSASGLKPGEKAVQFYCRNDRCRWYNEVCRLITIRADGTIPDPINHTGKNKIYSDDFKMHDKQAQDLLDMLKRNAEAEIVPGAEIRRS